LDQIKSVPLQGLIWWVVVRRCGKPQWAVGEFSTWNDEDIFFNGTEPSLFSTCKQNVKDFLEIRRIKNLILGMTLFLCVVIFSELSIGEFLINAKTGETT